MAQKEYRRIGGRGRRRREFFTWNTLWLGADHLLQVEHTGYAEEYKRFHFRDIQSITIQRDNRALYYSIFFAVGLGICLALMAYFDDIAARVFWGIAGSIFLLLLIINFVKGPSCTSRIKTAVQEEEIPAFRRIKKTEKAMAHIRQLIAATQGNLNADEIQSRIAVAGNSGTSPQTPILSPAPPLDPGTPPTQP